MPVPGIGSGLLRVGLVICLAYVLIAVGAGWLAVVQSGPLSLDPRNPLQLAAERSAPRGRILDARGVVVADNARLQDGVRRRRYPHPAMAPITGYKSILFGTAGLERTYDRQLAGLDQGLPGGELLRKFRSDPVEPNDLVLSVDVRFQELATRLLGDQRGAVVAIEPSTGRILALVSTPGYDPGRLVDPASARRYLAALDRDTGAPLLDRATQGRYVPGSVFKLVTAAAGLESGAIDGATTFPDQPAESRDGFRVDGFRIRDAPRDIQLDHPLDLFEAMEVSSNIWFAHAGLATGASALATVAARFGFGTAIDFDLPTEVSQVSGGDGPLDGFADRAELANAAYGQAEVLSTPLQMALVTAAIANDGVLMAPTLVDRLVSGAGGVVRTQPRQVGRVVSRGSAATIRDGMVQAVQGRFADSYAGGARVPGVETAGKSGTAQLAPGEAPHSWFVGFAPAEQPRIAIVVVVENGGSGSQRAVPLGGRLMTAWLKRFATDPGP
jgi:penicillin-binding protein A